MESYHKRKKLLEEKYGKLLYLKPYNDEKANNKIADNKHQNYVKQLQDTSDEEGLEKHMKQEMVYINIIINYLLREQKVFHKIIQMI